MSSQAESTRVGSESTSICGKRRRNCSADSVLHNLRWRSLTADLQKQQYYCYTLTETNKIGSLSCVMWISMGKGR